MKEKTRKQRQLEWIEDGRQQAGKLTHWLAGWLAGSGSETCTTAAMTSTATLFF
jgi:hypothetical protein